MPTLRETLEQLRRALPSPTSAVTLTRADLDGLLGHPDEVDPISDPTVSEIAEELGKAESTIRTWAPRITGAYKLHGKEWRVPRHALRAYLRRGGEQDNDHSDLRGGGDLSAWRKAS